MTSPEDGPPKNDAEPAGLLTPPAASSAGSADNPPTQSVATGGISSVETPTASPRGTRPPAFAPGQELAGRYRVVRFIARGGMGEVYEVEDLTLGGRVALKTVRADVVAESDTLDRFKREILVARRVSHPNVCRIHDVGFHAAGAERPMLFLTMELLHGETLSHRLAAAGRLSPAEAMPIVAQIAVGLDAAHKAGVIHRDFKSSNVMLVPDPRGGGGVRAVVTDFGLARPASSEDESLASLSETGIIIGTPAYMAPEQVEGRPLTPMADIYALGIVLYEMVTKLRPFDGGSTLSVAVRRLTEPPTPPRQHVPDLDPLWEATILRCLERDAAARFQSALEVVAALTGQAVTPRPMLPSAAPAVPAEVRAAPVTRRPWVLLAAVLLVVAAAMIAGVQRRRQPAPAASQVSTPAIKVRRSVAVLALKNASDQPAAAWLGTALREMVATELTASGELRAVPGQEVARAQAELGLSDPEAIDRENLKRLETSLGADLTVMGTYLVLDQAAGRLIRVDLRLQDAANAVALASGSATGTEGQLFDLVTRATGPLHDKLNLGRVSAAKALEVQASFPAQPEAAKLYSEGLAQLRGFDARAARTLLEKAVALAPDHPLPHAALAAAWLALGYEGKAREEAKAAAQRAGSVTPELKLAIEAGLHEASKDWPSAIRVYGSLLQMFPDNLEYGLRLAEAQFTGGKARDAIATLEALQRLPAPVSADARIDIALARAHQRLGDVKQQLAAAAAAASKARAVGAGVLVARARFLESAALDTLGQSKQSMDAADQARALFEAAGDRGGMARALERMAVSLRSTGDLAGSRLLFERALSIHNEIGDELSQARVLLNLGSVLLQHGLLKEAKPMHDEAVTVFRRIGARFEAAAALNSIGSGLQRSGDLDGAARKYQEALSAFGEIGHRAGVAATLGNSAEVLFFRGDLRRSQEMYEEALALERELGRKAGIAFKLYRLGEVLRVRGDLAAASDKYKEAMTLQSEQGDKAAAADSNLGLALTAIAHGQYPPAQNLAREAGEVLRAGKSPDRAALASFVLAEALLGQKKLDAARQAFEQGSALAAKTEDPAVRGTLAVIGARVRAASSAPADVAEALRSLGETARDCSKSGFILCSFEARLAAGQIEVASGKQGQGRARLKALAAEAQAKGFGLIVRLAQPN